jgi:PAS domain S-box-containing protein
MRPTPAALPLLRQTLLGTALDRFDTAAFVFDAHGVLVAVNEAALTMTGYSWDELFELKSAELMSEPARGPERVAAVVAGSVRAGSASIRRRDGTLLEVDFRVDATTLAAAEPYYLSLCWPSARAD